VTRARALVLLVAATLAAGAGVLGAPPTVVAQNRPAMGPMPMMPGTATSQTAPELNLKAIVGLGAPLSSVWK